MTDYTKLFDAVEKVRTKQQEENIEGFYENLKAGLTEDLNKAYAGELTHITYDKLLNNVKYFGFKVYRNSEGKHKLELNPEKAAEILA